MDVQQIDDETAFQIARDLVQQHGEGVAAFLQSKIEQLMASGDVEQLSRWFIIRNAVAITLESSSARH